MKSLTKRQRKQFNKFESLDLLKRNVLITDELIERIGDELYLYVCEPETIWYQGFLARYGIEMSNVPTLRERYPNFDKIIKAADKILEERYVSIPFHKHTLSKHCAFMLERHFAGSWQGQQQSQVGIHVGDIFTQLDAKPIIEVKQVDQDVQHGKEKLYLMEPELKSPPGRQLEMDVSDNKEELVRMPSNFFPGNSVGVSNNIFNSELEKISVVENSGPASDLLSNNLLNKSSVDVKEDIEEFMKRVRAGEVGDKTGNANKRKKGKAKKQSSKKYE